MQKIECKSGRTKNVCLDTAVFFCKSQNLWHPIYSIQFEASNDLSTKNHEEFSSTRLAASKNQGAFDLQVPWVRFETLSWAWIPWCLSSQMREAWKTPVVLNSIPRCATNGFLVYFPTFYQKHQPFVWGKYGSYTNIVQMTYFIIEIIDMMFTFPNF